MLVVPPKSQIAKLQLEYKDWELIQASLNAVVQRMKGESKTKAKLKLIEADVSDILQFLREEGRV